MSGIVGVFASIGDHIPIMNKEKLHEPKPEGAINRLHYRITATLIMSFCLLVTTTEWVSGKNFAIWLNSFFLVAKRESIALWKVSSITQILIGDSAKPVSLYSYARRT